jgi:flagella basal body P-ring formation protein FlgA
LFKKFCNYVLTILVILTFSKETIAITGKEISEKISSWLLIEGIQGKPIFPKTSVFKDCGGDIQINKTYNNYKTINVKCLEKDGFNLFVRIKSNKIVKNTKTNQKVSKIIVSNVDKNLSKKNKTNKIFQIVRLARSLEKNDIIKIEDLDLINTTKLSEKSFFNNKEDLVGRKLKKNLKVDQLLHPRHLYEKFEINTGDFLSIVSRMGKASVAVAGEAQNSGNLGDIIKVKNLRSGKIIKGYVNKNKIIRVFR